MALALMIQTLLYGKPLILFGRVEWAHDWVSNPSLGAVFKSLPGASFTVNGAPMPPNSALTTAGAQLFLSANWSLLAKFEGEFAKGSQTYAGSFLAIYVVSKAAVRDQAQQFSPFGDLSQEFGDSAAEIQHFKTRRTALLKDMQPDGVSFGDINLVRNTELALAPFTLSADGTYQLVQDIEAELLVFRLGYQ